MPPPPPAPLARPAAAAPLMDDACPRCGGRFHCGVADASPCPCSTLKLAPETLAALRQAYTQCLCLGCLQAVAAGEAIAPAPAASPRRDARP